MKVEKKKDRPTFVQREVIPAAKKALDYMNKGKEKPKSKATSAPTKKLKSRSKY